jgi:hypothetical protein
MIARPHLSFVRTGAFYSVGRMNHYAAPSQNPHYEQIPARSSCEFMKHPSGS